MKKPMFVISLIIALLAGIIVFYSQKKPHMPKLTLTSIQNHTLCTSALQNKVILVNFWATNCPGCIQEMPALINLHQKFNQKGFEIIAVAMHYDVPEYVLNYTKENQLPFFVTFDAHGEIAKSFGGISLTPTSFLINKEGEIIQKWVGKPDLVQLDKKITANLASY